MLSGVPVNASMHAGSRARVFVVLLAFAFAQAHTLGTVFTDAEIAACDKIRIPKIVSTPSRVIVFGQCRNYGAALNATGHGALGDDFSTNQIVSKTSQDGGKTWGGFKKWPSKGVSNPTPIYDHQRSAVILLYQQYPEVDPSFNITTFVQVSKDDGASFESPVDITQQISACSPHAPEHMVQFSAGSRVQTSSGRLLVTAHNDKGMGCVLSSDNGGASWAAVALPKTKEISVVEVNPGNLLMNGRRVQPMPPNVAPDHRINYRSKDDGMSWGAAEDSGLVSHECEGAMLSRPRAGHTKNTIFYSGVSSDDRKGLALQCSQDGGHTWPHSTQKFSGVAGYSDMAMLPDGKNFMVVFEVSGGKGGARSDVAGGQFCSSSNK